MAKKSMSEYAKGWKSPEEKREMRSGLDAKSPPGEKSAKGKAAANAKERAVAKKEAKSSPKNTTGAKGKDSADSKGPGPNDWTKGMKKPKGGGC